MAELRCDDGRRLDVVPVPVLDRTGAPYETTLRLLLDGAPFGEVGERCGGVLTALRTRLGAGRPPGTAERGVRAWAHGRGEDPAAAWEQLRPHLPREVELLDLRARDPDDVTSAGELRVVLRTARRWGGAQWQVADEVAVTAWGDGGTGVRAGLDLDALCRWLDLLLQQAEREAVRTAAGGG